MSIALRLILALAAWALAAAVGWWWQQPDAELATPPAANVDNDAMPAVPARPADDTLARRIADADPMGLARRAASAQQQAAGPGGATPAADSVVWRIAALVVRDTERYAVLTTEGQPPLRVAQGDRLPDGDLVKTVAPGSVSLQSPRGRLRTIYLTEP